MRKDFQMKLHERAICIFKKIKKNTRITLREIEKQTAIPKSSVHRHQLSQKKRTNLVGHDFFETEVGYEWLNRLFFAVILIFGIQSGVGAESISLFFKVVLLTSYLGASPSCIREVKQHIRQLIEEYGETQMPEILNRCQDKALHLGGDETTFMDQQFLILMELTSGFIFSEALESNRKYKTWWKNVGKSLKGFKKLLSFTSDGGRALVKLGASVACQNIMDLFHLLQDMRRLFATKFHSKRRALQSQLKKIKKVPLPSKEEQSKVIESIKNKMLLLDEGQKNYRNALFAVSTQSHPYQNISGIKTSEALEKQQRHQLAIFKNTATQCEIADKNNLLKRFENRIKASSRLNDLWHQWVDQSILCKTNCDEEKEWAQLFLLPYFYWEEQLRKSKRKKLFRIYYQAQVLKAKERLKLNPLTKIYLTDDWIDWAKAMAVKYQRTTSAIEGRNARLAHHYFSARGIRATHINSLSVLHNFWIKRADSTTAVERLCDLKPPDLFEWILKRVGKIPLPRNRQIKPSTMHKELLLA